MPEKVLIEKKTILNTINTISRVLQAMYQSISVKLKFNLTEIAKQIAMATEMMSNKKINALGAMLSDFDMMSFLILGI